MASRFRNQTSLQLYKFAMTVFTAVFVASAAHAAVTDTSIPKTKESKESKDKKATSKKTTNKGDKSVNPHVIMDTSMGPVEIELFADKAPLSVANFLKYTDEGFYKDTIFHRVIDGFMIQGGGFTSDMKQKPTHDPIKNEAANGLKNTIGTLAMARTSDVNSATAQFFINVKENTFLDYTAANDREFGYAVFGKVVSGMDVVNKIKTVPTSTSSRGMENVPTTPVLIKGMSRK
jgi:cyclophilin family peptidyl-prolyl cis-trans isomerase